MYGSVSSSNALPSPACALEIKSVVATVALPSSRTLSLPSVCRRRPEGELGVERATSLRLLGVYISSLEQTTNQKGAEMGKTVMSGPQNITLDGVVQDPDGEEGFEHGGWFKQYGGKDLLEWAEV